MTTETDCLPYEYTDLEHPDSFRTLELLAGQRTEPLKCKLVATRMRADPRFEALSYTWGAPVFPHTLVVLHNDGIEASIAITENLFDALQALRDTNNTRMLWIDAICINQKNVPEKNLQVAQMSKIYDSANQVLVWLGKDDCKEGVDELIQIGQKHEIYGIPTVYPFPRRLRDHTAATNLMQLAQSCDGGVLKTFFDRAWFERVWIAQEFILARDLVLYSGNCSLTYDLFSKACCALNLLTKRPIFREILVARGLIDLLCSKRFNLAWSLIQHREGYLVSTLTSTVSPDNAVNYLATEQAVNTEIPHTLSLIEHCVFTRGLNCYDKRDRVYGALGFAGNILDIQPDYEKPVAAVFTDLALKTILGGDLTVLHHAGLQDNQMAGLPSFAADFSQTEWTGPRLGGFGSPRFKASAQLSARVGMTASGLPILKAKVIGPVTDELYLARPPTQSSASDTAPTYPTLFNIDVPEDVPIVVDANIVRDLLDLIHTSWLSDRPFPYVKDLQEVFARTILADNALPGTKMLIGHHSFDDNDALLTLFYIYSLSWRLPGHGDDLFVFDQAVAKVMGRPVSIGLNMFEDDEPIIYDFPSTEPFAEYEDGTTIIRVTGVLEEKLRSYVTALSIMLGPRSIFMTRDGYLGLGPRGTAQGDIVVVFEGAQTPFVVRELAQYEVDPSSTWNDAQQTALCQLVGECFMYGWMDGRAMEADIPGPINIVLT